MLAFEQLHRRSSSKVIGPSGTTRSQALGSAVTAFVGTAADHLRSMAFHACRNQSRRAPLVLSTISRRRLEWRSGFVHHQQIRRCLVMNSVFYIIGVVVVVLAVLSLLGLA